MSVRHFKALLFKAAKIQKEIDREQKAARPDWMRLLKLKKLRLVLEDRLQRLGAAAAPPQLRSIRVRA
ncbi:MAG: hypothetical protein HXY22_02300 [Alphaproteobacteria bacterium]|nr:hypothetical protein [Alphaproteobacteria bacterium]